MLTREELAALMPVVSNPAPAGTVPFNGPLPSGVARPNVPIVPTPGQPQFPQQTRDQIAAVVRGQNLQALHNAGQVQPVDLTPHLQQPQQRAEGGGLTDALGNPVYGPFAPGNNGVAPDLYGATKLAQQFKAAPIFAGKVHSHDWDQWLLSLPFQKGDGIYNQALGNERAAAIARESSRGNSTKVQAYAPDDPRSKPAIAPGTLSDEAAQRSDQKANWQGRFSDFMNAGVAAGRMPDVVNYFGESITAKEAMGTKGANLRSPTGTGTQSSNLADGDTVDDPSGIPSVQDPGAVKGMWGGYLGAVDKKTLESSGKVIWMGPVTKMINGVPVTTDQYMPTDDAYYIPAKWAPEQVATFQRAMHTKVTGVMDAATLAKWGAVTKLMTYYTTAGVHMDLATAAGAVAGTSKGGGGGGYGYSRRGYRRYGRGGGGGGGGAKALVPADQAKYLLNQTMQTYVGRDATADEFNNFLGAIKGAAGSPDFDGQQYAIDWVKGAFPQKVGSFQAASQYYNVVQQLIGGG